ncbi:MAG: phosphoadenylyl-sulfate reductase [Aquisalinus sp.]|nr:phosphoadenylyl-sulfate reductase [Aquisalinus sp.]
MVVRTVSEIEREKTVARLNRDYSRASAFDVLSHSIKTEFPGRICVVSSFGTESALLLHIVARVDPNVPVFFLDTRKHFPETDEYVGTLTGALGLKDVRRISPNEAHLIADDPDGTLHERDTDRCCYIRKTLPMVRVLQPYTAWISGRKRFQGGERAELQLFESEDKWIKINPLHRTSQEDIKKHFEALDLPHHPLRFQGYPSIGCAPCTSPVDEHETDPRAGRWAGQDKTECGIHIIDGKVVRGAPDNG